LLGTGTADRRIAEAAVNIFRVRMRNAERLTRVGLRPGSWSGPMPPRWPGVLDKVRAIGSSTFPVSEIIEAR
jgi:hypothetical protein